MKTVCCEHKDGKINPWNRTGAPDINPNDQLILKKWLKTIWKRKKKYFSRHGAGTTGETWRPQSLLHTPHKDLLEMGHSPKT